MKHISMALAAAMVLAGCGDDRSNAIVTIDGPHSLSIGQSVSLTALTTDGQDTGYDWSIADPEIATVDAQGNITGVAAGEVAVLAVGRDTGAIGEHAVVVGQAVIVIAGSRLVATGSTVTLTATTINGVDGSYTWTSSDDAILTVDAQGASQGVVSGAAVGTASITVTGDSTGARATALFTVTTNIPNYEAWKTSGHADRTAEAFRHWDAEDPREIPTRCARCHSAGGFRDYIGEDGSEVGVVDQPAVVGSVIDCDSCHNAAAERLSEVTFPSGVVVEDLGAEARCMTCHQGRASFDSVAAEIAEAAVGDDTPSDALSFINIHYYAAGATLNAGKVRGGYQYTSERDAVYDWRFRHVPGKETCVGCHDPHSLEVRVDECAGCHVGVQSTDDLRNIRMLASRASDYDGDGDVAEGIYHEIQGLRALLLTAIQTYTFEQGLGAICYYDGGHPYWFNDDDGDGECNGDDTSSANRFNAWTPRLLKAAYNYQVAAKDPGGFAHNAKYVIQLLHDSTVDLNTVLGTPVDLTGADRNDPGHFNGASEAARHWDADDQVSPSCSRCHGGSEGLRFYLEYGVSAGVPEPDNGLDCATCHDDLQSTYDVVPVDSIVFPGGVEVTTEGSVSNLCGTCHSGREGKLTIDADLAAGNVRFRNVHYLPAAAVKKGAEAQVGYEYPGKSYATDWVHAPGNECTFCHDPVLTQHSFSVDDAFGKCTNLCHTTQADPREIRGNPFFPGALHPLDYDGDGSSTERLMDELADLAAALLAEMQNSAAAGGQTLCYSGASYPYFFRDTNGNGVCDGAEASSSNRFNAWTPALVKAAHNYQLSQKEAGAWVHNFDYMAQLLIDSAEDLGGPGAVAGFVRP